MSSIASVFVQLCVVLLLAPLTGGIIRKVKALTQKRKGAPVLQLYYDLFKLLKKGAVVSGTASWVLRATPSVVFGTALLASLLAPTSSLLSLHWFPGDVIALFSLLTLGRFFMILAGLDTASTFGGMGSSREAMISALIEPSILVMLFCVGLTAKATSVPQMMTVLQTSGFPLANPTLLMAFLALVIIFLAETCRIPVDDPSTHLELTMVHEAMLLEHSGRDLALMEYGAAVKQLVLLTLLVNLFFPLDALIPGAGVTALALSLLLYLIKIVLASVLFGVIETATVKFRLFSLPNLAALSFLLSFLGFLYSFVLGG